MTDTLIQSHPLAPEAQPLVENLIREYDARYGTRFNKGGAREELYRYPPQDFASPRGNFLLIQRDGRTIAGGAFMAYDEDTAEFKRIWTDPAFRRQGLAKRIVEALEDQAAAQGYTRVYLTTGFRQPEASTLYLTLGYRPLFDPSLDPELYLALPFEKHIGALKGKPGTAPLRKPGPPPELAAALATPELAPVPPGFSQIRFGGALS